MNIDLQHTLNEVVKIAQRAGAFIRHEGHQFDRSKIEEKGLNDLVSYVDKEAEKMIVQTLKFTLPDAGFITEEGTETHKAEKYNWVVDPLDGTTNFMHGLPPYSVSIALVDNDIPVLGVVYVINSDECYHAIKGGGAYCNRKKIGISKVDNFKDGLYITGMPYTDFGNLDKFWKIFGHFMQKSHGIRRLGSAAADLAYVAAGRSEGFFEHGLNPWDVAAGVLLVLEAGGQITDYQGGDNYVFGRSIIAGCAVQPEMYKVISSYWNEN
ncbi:MAG: inositol monophosphatase [Cyclobacteriaceae bacterium]|nr:inositol monophosphatase [Cyclobacteriaceae bacterium]